MRQLALCVLLLAACGGPPEERTARDPTPTPAVPPAGAPAPPEAEAEAEPEPAAEAEAEAGDRGEVVLVVLGSFPDDLLAEIEQRLVDEFAVRVRHTGPVPLPEHAYYAPRKRYRADVLLDFLHTVEPDPGARILGLTSVDISTTKGKYEDWGIFGLGEMPGRTSVISLYRLRRKAKDREHLRFRVGTTAVHEIGHTFGLDHCGEAQARCVMQDAEGSIANTDSSTGELGPACRAELEREWPL